MKTWNAVKVIGAVAVATVIMAAQARAIVAYDYTGVVGFLPTFNDPNVRRNFFAVNSAINVTAVGAFTSSGSFGAATVPVAIYQLTSGTWSELTATVESFSGSGSLDHGARMQDLSSPVPLTPGIYAIVAANYDVPGAPYWVSTYSTSGNPPTFNSGGSISIGSGGSPNNYVYTA